MKQLFRQYHFLFYIPMLYVLPLILNRNGGVWVSQTYGHLHRSVELLGFSASLVWIIALYTTYKQALLSKSKEIIGAIGFSMVYFVSLYMITDYLDPQYDYLWGYEKAALFLNEAKNPYEGTSYIYPPLLVQVFASILKIAPVQDLFYTYQVFQWLNVLLLYQLLCKIFQKYTEKIDFPFLPILIAILMMTCVPLFRSLHWQQVNIILLNLMLIGFCYADKNIWISGLAFALGIHLKIYPLIFGVLFLFTNRIKLCVSMGIWSILIWVLQTHFLQEMTLYQQFISSFRHTLSEMPSVDFFRNNSIRSPFIFLFYTLLKLPAETAQTLINIIVNIWRIGMISWVIYRCYHREIGNPYSPQWHILAGHFWDCIALMLLISPLLWEHHFVHCIPLLLAAFFTSPAYNGRMWLISLIFIHLLPTFDVFPFSYHRMAGLIILLYILPIYYVKDSENIYAFMGKKIK